jgi:hypothetical protein
MKKEFAFYAEIATLAAVIALSMTGCPADPQETVNKIAPTILSAYGSSTYEYLYVSWDDTGADRYVVEVDDNDGTGWWNSSVTYSTFYRYEDDEFYWNSGDTVRVHVRGYYDGSPGPWSDAKTVNIP